VAGDPDPVRIGIIGIGALTLRAVLPHLAEADIAHLVRVTALCDPVIDRARGAAARFGVPNAYGDVEAMLADDAVDAVTIVSPIGLHYTHCRLALEAGKHVHVNKTMTTTVDEADHLIGLAADGDLRLVASPGEVLRPQVRRARELIESGAIGTVSWAMCGSAFGEYHEGEPERVTTSGPIDPTWYFRRPGGGPMYDMTSYALHQLTSILGPARRVTAMSGVRVPEHFFQGRRVATDADDNTVLLLDFGNSLFAVVYGTAAGEPNPQFGASTFYGTRGVLDGVLLNGEPIDFAGRDQTAGAPVTDWEHQMRVLPHVVGRHREIAESHVFEDVMQLVRWVRDGVASIVTAEHARHVIDIIEAGYRAAATGVTQELRTSFALPA
jgi:predicted dehydrogenase